MGSIKLTAVAIEKMRTPEIRRDIYDSDVPGLVLRLLPSGTKSWSFTYRTRNKPRRLSLGVYPGVSLKLARERGREARAEIQRGGDPVQAKKELERERQLYGFESCVEDFVAKYCKPNLKTWAKVERLLKRHAVAEWGDRPIKEIRRHDVVELIDKVAEKTPGQSNHLRAFLSKMFYWLMEREVVETNPVFGVSRRHKSKPRNRVLDDTEIAALWTACEKLGKPFGACVQLLLLTGMRREEASRLRWDELDGDFALLPASRMKGGRDFKAALSAEALSIIEGMPRMGEYVFTTNMRTPISGWGKAKSELDKLMGDLLEGPILDWRIHDLRRTVASGLAKMGYRSEVIKRILGHAANANDVTEAHYNWHNYDSEALEASSSWARSVYLLT